MRVFVAGASGVIGTSLVALLVGDGHTVAGMTRSPSKADRLRELGAEPVICDVFDPDQLTSVVVRYGVLYGPGTYGGEERVPPPPRIHVEEAARATARLLEAPRGVVVVAEDGGAVGLIWVRRVG